MRRPGVPHILYIHGNSVNTKESCAAHQRRSGPNTQRRLAEEMNKDAANL